MLDVLESFLGVDSIMLDVLLGSCVLAIERTQKRRQFRAMQMIRRVVDCVSFSA